MIIQSGVLANFSAVFPGATPSFVAMSVYEDTLSPVLLLSPFLMNPVHGGAYSQKFTPEAGKLYIVLMAVYTDITFGTINTGFVPVAVAAACQNLIPPVSSIVGTVVCNNGA